MSRWIGRYLVAVGLVHAGMGAITYRDAIEAAARAGFWNALATSPDSAVAFWFLVSGLLTVMLGGLADAFEALQIRFPRWFGFGLLLLMVTGILLSPVSGFWLLLPPTVATLGRRFNRSAWRL
jgi:hypothetical protein